MNFQVQTTKPTKNKVDFERWKAKGREQKGRQGIRKIKPKGIEFESK